MKCPGIIKDNKLYYIIDSMDKLDDTWPTTIEEFNLLRKEAQRQSTIAGGQNGTPAKNGKVIKADTGEIIFEGSYQECEDYIGMKGNHFAEKAQTNKPYKSKTLGFKVLCIPEEAADNE